MEKGLLSLSVLWKLTRIPNLLIIGITQYFVAIFLIEDTSIQELFGDIKFHMLVVSTLAIAAGGYVINDYYDIKIDLVNKPDRVVIGSRLKRRKALLGHSALNFIGIALGFFISWKLALVNIIAASWLWLYSNQLKRLPLIGNISVAILTALAILLVGMYYHQLSFLVKAYAIFAFGISILREVIKDMEDLRGDARYGCKTLPIVWGIRKTKTFLFIISAIFVILIVGVAIMVNNIYLMLYFSAMGILILLFWNKLYYSDTKREYRKLSYYCKVFMLAGVLSMLFF